MIDKEDLLNNKDFYKSFKNGEDLTSFFKEMHKRAVEHMLDAELDAHLDNEKHQKSATGNYRNGHGTKKIKSARCAKSPDFEQYQPKQFFLNLSRF
ncbi:transposase [Flavobacterium cerinum]|uniref:Transposase n=1 Tax=Flavobacterium cerinum TaxID=2502784 RepID=A0ABY5IQZ7_9FLAO|nr:transposase [Flavobacterium cerinum]UUC44617.1 transposase [Flavobacterium cerinum]